MIEPWLKDDDFLHDVESAPVGDDLLHLWWLGQSGFLMAWNGKRLLFDPYLSDSLTKKYAETDKPHVRMTERVVDPARLADIDLVTSSHNHTDHLDTETLLAIIGSNPGVQLIIPEANRDVVASRLACDLFWPVGLNDGESVEVCGLKISGVPAAHEVVERDDLRRGRFLGYVVQAGPFAVYHSGDTVLYEGMEDILRPFQVDMAVLPINGRRPERRVAGNLDGEQAARLAKAIGARCVVPCHYDMFEFNTASPELFERSCQQIDQGRYVMQAGERLTINPALR